MQPCPMEILIHTTARGEINQQVYGYLMLQEQLWAIPHSITGTAALNRNRETTRDCSKRIYTIYVKKWKLHQNHIGKS